MHTVYTKYDIKHNTVLCIHTECFSSVHIHSSMQIAGLGTRGTGTCGNGTAGLGHAELGQHYWDSFYSVKMGKIVLCVKVLFSCDV